VTVTDGSLTASEPFVLTVNGVNDPPHPQHHRGSHHCAGHVHTAPSRSSRDRSRHAGWFRRASSGYPAIQTLVPGASIVFGGSGRRTRTVCVTPAATVRRAWPRSILWSWIRPSSRLVDSRSP
jgi:hypothetical protein